MRDNAFYNSREFLIVKIEDLEQDLKDAEIKHKQAIKEKRREAVIFELGIEIESITRKLQYYKDRLKEN